MTRTSNRRRSPGLRLVLGVVATLVLLGGLALLTGTEAGRVMATDLFGLALVLLLGASGLRALMARRQRCPAPDVGATWGEDRAEQLRRSPLYSHLLRNYWFTDLQGTNHPGDQ